MLVARRGPDAFDRSERRQGGKTGSTEKAGSSRECPGVVESTRTVLPLSSFFSAAIFRTKTNTCSLTVAGSRWRVFVRLE